MKTTVIFTLFGRAGVLHRSLLRLSKLTRPDEVLVVDDGSGPEVKDVCDLVQQQTGMPIGWIYNNNPVWDIASIPKNIGLKNATNDLLIFSEPETIFITDVVAQMKEKFSKEKNFVVTAGKMFFGKRNGPTIPFEALDNPMKYIEDFGWHEWKSGTVDLHGEGPTFTMAYDLVAPFLMGVLKKNLMMVNGWDESMSIRYGGGGYGFDDSVTGDTPITIRKDNFIDIIPIEDLIPQWRKDNGVSRFRINNVSVLSKDGFAQILYIYRHKVKKPIYKIQTTLGIIKVTGDHSLFQNGKEIKVSQLKVGDLIDNISLDLLIRERNTITQEGAWLYGFFAAEGTANEYHQKNHLYSWRIVNQNKELLNKSKNYAQTFFCEPFKIERYKDEMYGLVPVGERKQKSLDFRKEFYTQSGEKKIPQKILNGTRIIKRAFIDGFFAGDGSFDKSKLNKGYTTNSFTLARGIEQLLYDLGIEISVTTRQDKPKIILLRERKSTFNWKVGITKIEIDKEFEGYIYDLSTHNHTFVAGLGGIIAHNSDLLTRLRIKGIGQKYPREVVALHQWHERPPQHIADGWKRNEEIMAAKNLDDDPNNPKLLANEGIDWGRIVPR